ncbi:hypothetical protein [Mucilaginibacter lacusdianchii]|uniref:hypothetical protein n=1 Tax=Mucilaginibacter lacusdianchii TaxID=2684211 RepID=UPI00131B95EE|nr:hypothetical protein [Mucilaginibacter sp. JXJ CY 39]
MKRKFLGLAAVILALGASAFTLPATHATGKQVSYKWFSISGTRTLSQADSPSNATYLGEGETPPAGSENDCSGSGHQCVSGFSANQVTSTNQLNGSQVPMAIGYERQ